MRELKPVNQLNLIGLENYILELIDIYKKKILPNKILLSGIKGIGKSTLAYHLINYILSQNEQFEYNLKNFTINDKNQTYKTIQNKSNTNFFLIDINPEKKFIDIDQIRSLIINLNKTSFNKKPRFVLIDNVELLNMNSVNALLKILEEPTHNVHFILINSNKKILPTLSSRCINYKISLSNKKCLEIINKLCNNKFDDLISKDLISYYLTPGNAYRLIKFADNNNYDLSNINLKEFLRLIINENHYKKDNSMKMIFFDLTEYYFRKINQNFSSKVYDKYSYFLKRISDTKRFNLDEDSLFIEFEEEILNG